MATMVVSLALKMPKLNGSVRWAVVILAFAGVAAGCGAQGAPLPLRPEPIPYSDTLPVAEPAEYDPIEMPSHFKASFGDEMLRPFNLRKWAGDPQEALNVTHFDDVVNSAWFEHRNAQRRMSLEEVARGPATTSGPDTSRTLTVIGGKSAGISPGFTVRDARGDIYLFKFDPQGSLHLASSADVISSRLFYAAGYHTPADFVVVFDSARLVLDPEAEVSTVEGDRLMREDDIIVILSRADPPPDGGYLALATKILKGVRKGPFRFKGVRKDDPNDYYHHQFRRELRGLYVVSAWLNHVDMRFANTLDMYVEAGYLKHHLLDFAATLGSGTIRPHRPREGVEYNYDFWPTTARMLSLGFFTLGWEDQPFRVIHPAIGYIPVEDFDPGTWKANWPNAAFNDVTARDGYWGAKLVGSFSDEQLRAVVAEGQLPSPQAADTLAKILAYRRDRTVEHWYAKVSPIENAEIESPSPRGAGAARVDLAFDDLGLGSEIWSAEETTYRWEFEHKAFSRTMKGEAPAVAGSRQMIAIDLAEANSESAPNLSESAAIATLRIVAVRPASSERAAIIYLRWDKDSRSYTVVGLQH